MSTPRAIDLPHGTVATSVETAWGKLAALDAAPDHATDRAPLLLVPGYTGSKEDFLGVLALLAEPGRRVVAIDQHGQHESPHAVSRDAYALDALASDVLDVVESLGGRAHLVGHSFGGFVTRRAAALAEDRPDVEVVSHVLMDSGPGRVTGTESLQDLTLLAAALSIFEPEVIWAEKLRMARDRGKVDPPASVLAFLERRFVGTDPAQLAVAAEILGADVDRTLDLRSAGVPLLVIAGELEDVWSASAIVDMAQAVGVEAVVIAGAGHSPAVDDPERTAQVINAFVERVEGSTRR